MSLDEDKREEINELIEKEKRDQELANIFQKKKEDKKEVKKLEDNTASELVDSMHKQAMVGVTLTEEDIQERVKSQARKSIEDELDAIDQQGVARKQRATYDANEEACKNYGIDKSVETWKIRMMKVGSAFWFVIYFIIASVTIAPISVFVRGLTTFVKRTWIAIVLAVLAYLFITIGIPLIIKYRNELGLG